MCLRSDDGHPLFLILLEHVWGCTFCLFGAQMELLMRPFGPEGWGQGPS